MTKTMHLLTLSLVFALGSAAIASQGPPAPPGLPGPPAAAKAGPQTPLKIQVVISRYQGEKKTSSFPYTLSVAGHPDANGFMGKANLRMGAKVPITVTTFGPPVPGDNKETAAIHSYQYQDVGTNIDCLAWVTDDGRFRLDVTIDDSSVYPDEKDAPGAVKGVPSLRSFRASDSLLLKDGGTAQFTTATDKVSGEVVKVDVTLTVVK